MKNKCPICNTSISDVKAQYCTECNWDNAPDDLKVVDDDTFATIFREDLEYISRCMLDYPDIETGGDFFGFWNNLGYPVIQYVIGPGEKSFHHVAFFKQDVDFLLDAGNVAYQTFGMQHIGAWHSHHTLELASPSTHDCQTMIKAINKNRLSQFFMVLGNIRNNHTVINGFLFDKHNQLKYIETQWHILERENPFTEKINSALSLLFFKQSPNTYKPKTQQASIVNLKTVNPRNESVFVLDFEPEKWLGSKKGKEELKYVYEWTKTVSPEAKMFLNDEKDLSVVAAAFKIIFPNDFPDSYPTVIIGHNEIKKDGYFEYKDKEDIISYLAEHIHPVLQNSDEDLNDWQNL